MSKSKEQSKLRRKFRRFWSKNERKTEGFKQIKKEHDLQTLVDEAVRMQMWCAKKNKKFSLLRFYKWISNLKKWSNERHEQTKDLEQLERERTRDVLKRYQPISKTK